MDIFATLQSHFPFNFYALIRVRMLSLSPSLSLQISCVYVYNIIYVCLFCFIFYFIFIFKFLGESWGGGVGPNYSLCSLLLWWRRGHPTPAAVGGDTCSGAVCGVDNWTSISPRLHCKYSCRFYQFHQIVGCNVITEFRNHIK